MIAGKENLNFYFPEIISNFRAVNFFFLLKIVILQPLKIGIFSKSTKKENYKRIVVIFHLIVALQRIFFF